MSLTKEEYLEILGWYAKKCYYESKHSHENTIKVPAGLELSKRTLRKLRTISEENNSDG
tara:strand:- start:177 stop:353 length:177 start_codon:yes stop_codon:yes gene_type:complete